MAGSVSNVSHIVSLESRSDGNRYAELGLGGDFFGTYLCDPGQFQLGLTNKLPSEHGTSGLTSDDGGVAWNAPFGRIEQSGAYIHSIGDAPALASTDYVRIAMRLSGAGGRVWMARNAGAWVGGGDPAADTTPTALIAAGNWYLGTCAGNNIGFGPTLLPFFWRVFIRTRADQFVDSIPTGFVPFA